jgi:hypothetical protein
MLDGIVETLRREIPLPAPECALQDGIVAVNRANRERRAAAQCIENLALTDAERDAMFFCYRAALPETEKLGGNVGELCRMHRATLAGLLDRLTDRT